MFGVFKDILDGAQATDGIHQIIMPEKEIPALEAGMTETRRERLFKKCYYSRVCQRVLEI